MKVVIVGGVAGGASAAARARRLSEEAEIVVIERGPDVSFANCGLPYYVGGEIDERSRLLVVKPELLRSRFRLDVRTRSEVVSIDRVAKTVRVKELEGGREYEESYDALVLSPGAAPLRPPIPGIDLPGVMTLRTMEDSDRIKAAIDSGARRAVVVGAGFIGLEMVENFVRRGIETTLVELQAQVLPPLDAEMARGVEAEVAKKGVRIRLGTSATAFEEAPGGGVAVSLANGERIEADVVLLGVGVRPESGLAKAAGLEVGPRGGIRVDEQMRTSDPSIFAVGDAVEVRDALTGEPTQVPLGGPANRQGRIAADVIFGRESRYRGTQGTAIVRVFGVTAAMTGLSEKALRRAGRTFEKVYTRPNQHASYYPGAEAMTIKLLFEPGVGTILGAQIVGGAGVDTRIDVLAMAIQAGMTVFDLEEAELAYSPQYGSAKDAINMAGFVSSAVARGDYRQVYAEDIEAFVAQGGRLIDVRTSQEHHAGAIGEAVNLPLDELRSRVDEVPTGGPLVVYCQSGQRGYVATRLLSQRGLEVANLAGGYLVYRMVRGD